MGVPVLKKTTEFRIEKGVEMPGLSGDATRKYPFNQMEVGDSFAVPVSKEQSVRNSSFQYGKVHKIKFSVRKHAGAFRCWRIA